MQSRQKTQLRLLEEAQKKQAEIEKRKALDDHTKAYWQGQTTVPPPGPPIEGKTQKTEDCVKFFTSFKIEDST